MCDVYRILLLQKYEAKEKSSVWGRPGLTLPAQYSAFVNGIAVSHLLAKIFIFYMAYLLSNTFEETIRKRLYNKCLNAVIFVISACFYNYNPTGKS